MAILKDLNDEIPEPEQNELRLELRLLRLIASTDGMSEGWIGYEIALYRGKEEILQTSGTIHDSDLQVLEKLLLEPTEEVMVFEPMEPDFQLRIVPRWGNYTVTCMLEYNHGLNGIYSRSAVGIRVLANRTGLRKFAEDLRVEHLALTKGIDFPGAEAKSIL